MKLTRKRELLPLTLLCAFLVIALLTGGASRADAQSQILLRPASVLFGSVAVAIMLPGQIRKVRSLLFFLLALVGLMLAQLVPLPPVLWTGLPGRDLYAQISPVLGIQQPWRPISLSPTGTWNSIAALLPPLAVLLLFATVTTERNYSVLPILIGVVLLSALLGLAQIIGPSEGPLYLYRITNNGSAVGFFANRNHQAVMLACLYPMLAVLASLPTSNPDFQRFRFWASVGAGILLIPLLIVTGSRSGVVLGLVGIIGAWLLYPTQSRQERTKKRGRVRIALWVAVGAIAAGLIASTVYLSRADAFYRLFDQALTNDLRFKLFDSLTGLAIANAPFGTGFGTFEPVFKVVEPFSLLQYAYVNHAHNDLLELAIEGSVGGLAILATFLVWWLRRSIAVWKSPLGGTRGIRFARLGSAVTLILLLGSIVDYPLRTPFVMVVFALSCAWLALPGHEIREKRDDRAP